MIGRGAPKSRSASWIISSDMYWPRYSPFPCFTGTEWVHSKIQDLFVNFWWVASEDFLWRSQNLVNMNSRKSRRRALSLTASSQDMNEGCEDHVRSLSDGWGRWLVVAWAMMKRDKLCVEVCNNIPCRYRWKCLVKVESVKLTNEIVV